MTGGRRGCLSSGAALVAVMLCTSPGPAGAAEFAHYPGAYLDAARTQTMSRGGAVYATSDRFERVAAFYGQYLTPLPVAAGALFCPDRVQNPGQCRRFVELVDLSPGGVATRTLVYGRD